MRRDRLTFAMMVGIPIIQLVLFGFAINTDPKHLPTAVLAPTTARSRAASSRRCRTPATSTIVGELPDDERGRAALARGDVQFVVTIPGRLHARGCCAASGRRCWSRPMRPTRRPPATRSPR